MQTPASGLRTRLRKNEVATFPATIFYKVAFILNKDDDDDDDDEKYWGGGVGRSKEGVGHQFLNPW